MHNHMKQNRKNGLSIQMILHNFYGWNELKVCTMDIALLNMLAIDLNTLL